MTIGPVTEQNWKAYWLETLADLAEPTVAEIDAGVSMGRLLAVDNTTLGVSQDSVEIRTVERKFIPKRGGTWTVDVDLKLFRDDEDEAEGWDLVSFGDTGFLVIVPWGDIEAGTKAMTVPAEWGQRRPGDPAANDGQHFMVNVFVHAEPNFDAVIAV